MSPWKRCVTFAAVILLFVAAPTVVARQMGDDADDEVLEHAGEPYRAPLIQPVYARPGARGVRSARGLNGLQVNIDALGHNIPGDAANEPSIAIDPADPRHVVVGWRQFDTISSNFRQAGHAYSRDGGHTWVNPGVFTPGVFRSDPVLGADLTGRIFYYSLATRGTIVCDMFFSDDGGMSWTGPIDANGGDKAWFAVDTTGGVGSGNVYAHWSSGGCCGSRTFTRSTDGGVSYFDPIALPGSPRWGTTAVGPNGELYIAGISGTNVIVLKSIDAQNGGNPTFVQSTVVPIGGTVGSSGAPNPGGLLGQVWLAVDRSDGASRGDVYVLASTAPGDGVDPLDVHICRSIDGGASFAPFVRVNDDPPAANSWQWFGTLAIAPNGRLDVVWNDTRDSQNAVMSRLYYSSSVDGGQTWSTNGPLGDTWNSVIGWPSQNKIGDYYHMLADDVGASLAYSATLNGEQDVYFRRIGDYDCNGNGLGDADDIASGRSTDLDNDGVPDECECLADLNGDDVVNLSDLGALLSDYGCTTGCLADLDHDGDTDLSDLGIMLARFGLTCP